MNNAQERMGVRTIMAAFGLSALPPEAFALTVNALRDGARMSDLHEAAHAMASETPVTSLEGVICTLLFLANPNVDVSDPFAQAGDEGGATLPVGTETTGA